MGERKGGENGEKRGHREGRGRREKRENGERMSEKDAKTKNRGGKERVRTRIQMI